MSITQRCAATSQTSTPTLSPMPSGRSQTSSPTSSIWSAHKAENQRAAAPRRRIAGTASTRRSPRYGRAGVVQVTVSPRRQIGGNARVVDVEAESLIVTASPGGAAPAEYVLWRSASSSRGSEYRSSSSACLHHLDSSTASVSCLPRISARWAGDRVAIGRGGRSGLLADPTWTSSSAARCSPGGRTQPVRRPRLAPAPRRWLTPVSSHSSHHGPGAKS